MTNVLGSGIRTCTLHKSNNNGTMWRNPALGEVKYDVDAAIFKDNRCYSIRMCMRDAHGEYIVAKTVWFQGIP